MTAAAPSPRSKVTVRAFIDAWAMSKSVDEVAHRLHLSRECVIGRADYYRRKGIKLKKLLTAYRDWPRLAEYAAKVGATRKKVTA